MIKKLIFATIIFLGLLTPVSSFAMEYTLPEIYSLGDLGYGLAAGAQWDFTGKDEYLIENLPQLSANEIDAAATMRARHFLEQYAINRGIPYAEDGQVYDNPKDYLVSTYFNKSVVSLYQKYQMELEAGNVNADATLRMPISRQRMTDWSGYKIGIAERYLNSFVYGMDLPDQPVVNPDPNFLTYINKINDFGAYQFYWSTATTSQVYGGRSGGFDRYVTPIGNWDTHSYFVWNTSGNMGYSFNFSNNGWNISNYMGCTESVLDLNIISNNNSYTGTISNITAAPIWKDQYNTNWYAGRVTYNNGVYSSTTVYRSGNDGISNKSLSYSGTLSEVFNYFGDRVRNVNIYVDGEPWSLVSDPAPADPLLPEFPDVINTDYGPIETVDLPATPDNNGTFDITSLFDAIKEAIIGASDTDPDTDGTLGKEGVTDTYRDTDGELTGEEDIPLEDVIEDSFPIEDTSNYPDIILPYEPIHNAFMGTTVLAQLIDATQTVLPEELILVFWGIVFILFIIGLIKILHK